MTRIYTNVPAMIARANLGKNMSALQTSLERLSTGFKINSGKDDPAGLIASEMLRSDITGIKMAIRNTERANMMIATADSALNEVTNLLNDIRGLVTEAASTGTMSQEMIAANQLQVNASLDAIDRIAAQTTFMGTKLLDGSLDFNYVGVNRNDIQGLSVHQVTFPTSGALEVTINVREAAEKAALYYNQPALAETIVLRWGGNYGYDMQTFEKGATVAQIAEIVNGRSDATGVVAEVGSDALAGMLYVSSLGYDNDMIIRAGLEGLNAGNVEIKYMKGSSEGIQVMYEEPLFPGAPAKIVVYLQTEAYEAAFADDVDTTWTMQNGVLVPRRDNNALKFEANIEGAQYNNANIFYVDGSLTDPRFYTSDNPTGTAGMPYAYYSDSGQASSALFGYVPGTGSTGVNGTGIAFDLGVGEYFSIQSRATGSEYNNVNVQFVAASPGDAALNNREAYATYVENKDAYGNVTSKTLTIFYANDGDTTLKNIQEALNILNGNTGHAFDVKLVASAKKLDDVSLVYRPAGQAVNSNTHNSGGAEGSLFIVLPPDGKMPKTPDTPEKMGVTAKPISNGNYLAHKDAIWDNITLNFIQNTTVPGNNVVVVYDEAAKTLSITAEKDATYDNILDAINGATWSGGKPSAFNGKDLFWSDVIGNPKVPDVPKLLATTASAGVVGKSLQPVATIDGDDLYLYHDDAPSGNSFFDEWTFEFTQVSSLGKSVTTSAEGKVLKVSYGPLASYTDILKGINDWADMYPGGPHFEWITADGDIFVGTTTAAQSTQDVLTIGAIDYRLEHDSPAFNGFEIRFVDAFGTNPLAPAAEISRSGSVITVNYNSSTASVDNILTALNGSWGGQRPAGVGDFYWYNMITASRVSGSLDAAAASFDGIPPGTGAFVAVGNVQFTLAATTGTDNLASSSLRTINTGTYLAKTNIPAGDSFYLAHTNSEWDKFVFNFTRTGTTGGYVSIAFDGTNINVEMDDDATFEEILKALNNPFDDPPTGAPPWGAPGVTYNTILKSNWELIGGATIADMPQFVYEDLPANPGVYYPITSPGLHWVNAQNIAVDPAIPAISSAGLTTNSGVYRPFQFSPDGRSTLVADGMYLQHTDKSWDNLDIKFVSSGAPSALIPRSEPPITINFDGKMVTVIADTNMTYDDILLALNDPHGTKVQNMLDEAWARYNLNPLDTVAEDFIIRWADATAVPTPPLDRQLTTSWAGWLNTSGTPYTPISQLPKEGDLRWVDVNGYTTTVTTPVAAKSSAWTTTIDLEFSHDDPKWDGFEIRFIDTPATPGKVGVNVEKSGNILTVTFDSTAIPPSSLQDIEDALNGTWSGKPAGIGKITLSSPGGAYTLADPLTGGLAALLDANRITLAEVTYKSNVSKPNPPLNHVVHAGAIIRDITANDVAALFDLDNAMSRGSERAASLFTVTSTVDNDGTGLIRLYDYFVDTNGNVIGWYDSNGVAFGDTSGERVYVKSAFEKVFQGGVTGGDVITTAAELTTALNNSALWGMMMCNAMIAELAAENAAGKYADATNPPVLMVELTPGTRGTGVVSVFQEVAYYGDPNENNALQFLGGLNSPNIRFVVDGPNSELSLDRTTVPAIIQQAHAVLTAQDSGSSLVITANQKGGDYDDVQFVFKRVGEDAQGVNGVDRRDGWVEYDPGDSFAEAQATFTTVTGGALLNSAFYVTATERGDIYNNVDIIMRLDDYHTSPDPVAVSYDAKTGQLRISIDSSKASTVSTNDIITAINNAKVPFEAQLSYSENPLNKGTDTLDQIGLTTGSFKTIANTGNTGGRNGTVTVWLADANPGPGAPDASQDGIYRHPTQEDIVRLINSDSVVSRLFTARAYNTVEFSDGKQIDFVKDGPIFTSGGLVEPALITVHLAADAAGNVTTTAADLVAWWNSLNSAFVDGISASIVRPAGAVWDECSDPYGNGLLAPTIKKGDCDEWIVNDIQFVGWNDSTEQQYYVESYATGTMTSQRGIDSSYQLTAKLLGPEWDGFTIEYIDDGSVTGRYADNLIDGAGVNPCDYDPYTGLPRDDCGNLLTQFSTTDKGMRLVYDEATKKITVYVKFNTTTANDIQAFINSHDLTRNRFEVTQLGNGTGLIHPDDDTLLTAGGKSAPGNLNGAKLLFGSDATDYYLIFRSVNYGSDQFVDVQAYSSDGKDVTFSLTNAEGKVAERDYGADVDAIVNGIRATGSGLNISLNTSSLALDFTFSERAGTTAGYSTNFVIDGGGATFQVGPDVVSQQQITMGIRSINTVLLGGVSGVLHQLREGQDADLFTDTNKAFRIVQESLTAITSIRGRLGTMQRATLETNINVLNDTLSALTEAESQIRDTDFAEETSNLTRAQILVQANMNTLGIANQIPNYMLSLIGR